MPLLQALDIVVGHPVLKRPAGLAGVLSALHIDQQVAAVLGVDDEVEAFEFGLGAGDLAGREGTLGLVDGDVGDGVSTEVVLERTVVVEPAVGHGGHCNRKSD